MTNLGLETVGEAVCVAGMHRAGTSMVADLLGTAGVHLGDTSDLIPPAADNPKGFWEHSRFVQINDELLAAGGGGWDCPPADVERWWSQESLGGIRADAKGVVAEVGGGRSPWGWKDPRNSLTLAFWLDLLPGARVVICLRNPLEVAVSLNDRNGMSYARSLALWATHYRRLLAAAPGERRIITHYDALLLDPHREVERLLGFVDLELDEHRLAEASAVLDKGERHSRFGLQDLDAARTTKGLRQLYAELCAEAGWLDHADVNQAQPTVGDAGPSPTGARIDGEAAGSENTGCPAPEDERSEPQDDESELEASTVDIAVVDYRLLRYRYLRRGGYIAILEKRLADAEHARGGLGLRLAQSESELDRARLRGQDSLQASVYDLAVSVAAVEERLGADPGHLLGAQRLRRLRESVRSIVPAEARLLVLGRHAPPTDLYGRSVQALVVEDHGEPAVERLERERALGTDFVAVLPQGDDQTQPTELIEHLRRHYQVHSDDDAGVVADLRSPRSSHGPPLVSEVLADLEDRLLREVSVMDWHSGLDLVNAQPHRSIYLPSIDEELLPHLDRSIDVVLIGSPNPVRLAEARRVATIAVLVKTTDGTPASPTVAVEPVPAALPDPDHDPHPTTVVLVAAPGPAPSQQRWIEVVTETTAALGARVIGVVDGSGPPGELDADIVARRGPDGRWKAMNAAAEASESELVVFVDGRAVPHRRWLSPLVRLFDDPVVGAACGRLLALDGHLLSAGGALSGEGVVVDVGQDEPDPEHPRFTFVRDVDHCAGAVLAVRRDAFLAVGGFDSGYVGWSHAMADLGLALRSMSLRLRYQPASVATEVSYGPRSDLDDGRHLIARWGGGRLASVLAADDTPGPNGARTDRGLPEVKTS